MGWCQCASSHPVSDRFLHALLTVFDVSCACTRLNRISATLSAARLVGEITTPANSAISPSPDYFCFCYYQYHRTAGARAHAHTRTLQHIQIYSTCCFLLSLFFLSLTVSPHLLAGFPTQSAKPGFEGHSLLSESERAVKGALTLTSLSAISAVTFCHPQ